MGREALGLQRLDGAGERDFVIVAERARPCRQGAVGSRHAGRGTGDRHRTRLVSLDHLASARKPDGLHPMSRRRASLRGSSSRDVENDAVPQRLARRRRPGQPHGQTEISP